MFKGNFSEVVLNKKNTFMTVLSKTDYVIQIDQNIVTQNLSKIFILKVIFVEMLIQT